MNDSALNTKFVEEETSSVVSAALIHSIFNTPGPLFSGIIFVTLAAGFTAEKSGLPLLWAATAGLALTGAARLYTMKSYYNRPLPLNENELSRLKHSHNLGAIFQVAAIGFWAFVAIAFTDDTVVHMIAFTITIALTAGGAARAYGQQQVFRHQVLLAFGPMAIALLIKSTLYHTFLAAAVVTNIVALRTISANLHSIFMQALTKKEEANIFATQFNVAVSNIPIGLSTYGPNGRLAVMNQRFREMAKLPPGIIHADPTLDDVLNVCVEAGFISCDDAKTIQIKARTAESTNIVTTTPDTENSQALSWTIQRIPDGGVVVLVEDITERRNTEARIAHLATHDGLTDLPNRIGFQNTVEPLLTKNNDCLSAILYIDLDHFKQVNDTLGHPVGDRLLQFVAGRLRQSIREQDIAARFGGDEFAVFIRDMESPDDAAVIAARIVETLSRRYDIDKAPIEIGASVGITFTRPFANYDIMLKNADLALYEAKAKGRGIHCFFDPDMAEKVEVRRVLEMDFPSALANSELELYFQPLVSLKSRKAETCEALLRWNHPVRGFISPPDIISIAQYVKQMPDLGRWILNRACAECVKWPGIVAVAVNMSPTQLKANDFIADIREALDASGLPPHRLNIEITEGALLDNNANTQKILAGLHDLGVGVSLDDFGTGYSSLSYLHHFRRGLQKVKIDRSFLDGNDTADALTVLRSVAQLSTDLGLSVVVEGIETNEQLELITACNTIDEGQGFLFSRPVPAAEIGKLLDTIPGFDILKTVGDAPRLITETSLACPAPAAPDTRPLARRPTRQSSGRSRRGRATDKGKEPPSS